MMIIIIMVVFCKWYFKSYFCIRGCLLRHKSTAPHPNPHFSPLLSHASVFLIFRPFLTLFDSPLSCLSACSFNVKHAAEMDLLLWTRSISLFSLLSPPSYFPCCFLSFIPPPSLPFTFLKGRHFQHVYVPARFTSVMHL